MITSYIPTTGDIIIRLLVMIKVTDEIIKNTHHN